MSASAFQCVRKTRPLQTTKRWEGLSMNAKLVGNDLNDGPVTADRPGSEQLGDEKPLLWCNSCGTYMPRHTCEWKVLIAVVLGAGVISVVGVVIMLGSA